jgi:ElaA protein
MHTTMPKIETEWQRFDTLTSEQLYELLRFRQDVFVVEQRSPYPDLDGLDQSAWHLIARVKGAFAGYLRLIPQPLSIGRVAVATTLRRRGVGRRLMTEALILCRECLAAQPIRLSAQLHLVPFYERLGFMAASDTYDDFGVPHVDMILLPLV